MKARSHKRREPFLGGRISPISWKNSTGSNPMARAKSKNSITSRRRSPRSNFETNDCVRFSRAAKSICVTSARFRYSTSFNRKFR